MEFSNTLWRKSSLSSETEACVEIAYPAEALTVGIRDSKDPAGGVLLARVSAWEALRLAAKGAELDSGT
jgi:hypothetical protein